MLKLATTKFLTKTTFIHYGTKRFRKRKFKTPLNHYWNKPAYKTGFWASPVTSEYGWIDWCRDEGFRVYEPDNHIKFKIKRNAHVLIIEEESDLDFIPYFNSFGDNLNYSQGVDFEKLVTIYDAIILTEEGQRKTRLTGGHHLYGWDCECILIINKNIIKFF